MSNHYFIGIGGTGGNILCALRKSMHLRDQEVRGCGDNLRCAFLYIDSNRPELFDMGKKWSVLGKSVDLNASDKLLIKEGNLDAVFQNIGQYPHISPWIGRVEEIRSMLGAESGTPGAQQRRRFGRFLFANNNERFRNTVNNKVRQLTDGVRAECTFHLFGTLGGGTGSGGIIDAAIQIRNLFPQADDYKINTYVLITADDGDDSDVGFFYPNQYAALKDLNALMVNQLKIHNLGSPRGELFTQTDGRQVLHKCVLISNHNGVNKKLSKDQQEKIVAEWVLQVVVAQANQNLPADFTKSLTMEDFAASAPGEPQRFPVRSFRFASIGIFRWSVPEEQIREYFSSKVSIMIVDQFIYNNWIENRGFIDQSKTSNVQEFCNVNPIRNFGIAMDQITHDGTADFPKFQIEWGNRLRKGVFPTAERSDQPLSILEDGAERFFTREFRDTGVKAYFSNLVHDAPNRAKQIMGVVEQRLRGAWVSGQLGLSDLGGAINQIMRDMVELTSQISSEIPELDRIVRRCDNALSLRRSEWGKMGPLTALFGKKKKLIGSHLNDLIQMFDCRTRIEGLGYCSQLFGYLTTELATLKSVIDNLQQYIIKNRSVLVENHSIQEAAFGPENFMNKTELDRELVAQYLVKITTDKDRMSQLATVCRQIQDEGLDDLYELHQKGVSLLFNRIERESDSTVSIAHDQIANNPKAGLGKVLGMNLLERLFKRFGSSPDALRQEVTSFVHSAIATLHLDSATPQPAWLSGTTIPTMPRKRLLVLLPRAPLDADQTIRAEHAKFIHQLEETVKGVVEGDIGVEFAEAPNTSEMTVIALTYWMAARFADCIKTLKQRYIEKISGGGDAAAAACYFCHLHDTWGSTPDLFPESSNVLRQSFKAYTQIGRHLGLIETDKSGRVFLVRRGIDGIPVPEEIAANDVALESLPDVRLSEIRASIHQNASLRLVEDFKRILEAENQKVLECFEKCNSRATDPAYTEVLEVYERIKKAIEEIKGSIK
ncbi:MAG: tubulin-like doman-containing protein [Candidatus Competibacteraceae bacterium]